MSNKITDESIGPNCGCSEFPECTHALYWYEGFKASEAHLLSGVYCEIIEERRVQDAKWGGKAHDDSHNEGDWRFYIRRHTDKAAYDFRKQMIRVAALAVAAVESYDRTLGKE